MEKPSELKPIPAQNNNNYSANGIYYGHFPKHFTPFDPFILHYEEDTMFVPILQMKKLSHRKCKVLSPKHICVNSSDFMYDLFEI